MLCAILGGQTAEQIATLPAEVQMWWADHQKHDAERKAREAETLASYDAKIENAEKTAAALDEVNKAEAEAWREKAKDLREARECYAKRIKP